MRESQAVKRLMKEFKDLQTDPSAEFTAAPLQDNVFEWLVLKNTRHFTIRGPAEGGFNGGRYHGRIVFSVDYPFKPPDIYFLTPNGRFEVNKKICLSITGYHPEFWRPAWGVRSVLIALISFMNTPGDGAIGAIDYSQEERADLAKQSRSFQCRVCSSDNATCLPDESEQPVQKLECEPELVFTLSASTTSATSTTSASADVVTEASTSIATTEAATSASASTSASTENRSTLADANVVGLADVVTRKRRVRVKPVKSIPVPQAENLRENSQVYLKIVLFLLFLLLFRRLILLILNNKA